MPPTRNLVNGLFLNRDQLYIKKEGGIRPDFWRRPALSVGEAGRDDQLPLRTDRHELQRFLPAFNHTIYWKADRLAAAVRTVELRAVDESAAVMSLDSLRCSWERAISSLYDFVLQELTILFATESKVNSFSTLVLALAPISTILFGLS